jgi:thiosulfate/3-mercaptopyruvate sulfurtransferase
MAIPTKLALPQGPLVSVSWLAAARELAPEGALRVVDIRGKTLPPNAPPPRYLAKCDDYKEAHIPGALFVDWTRDIVDLNDKIPVQIAPAARFAEEMTRLGIDEDTAVVIYDDYSHMFAGRLHWALRYYGHDAVRILEGGFRAWREAGFAVASSSDVTVASPPRAAFTPRPRLALRRSADDVEVAILNGALIIDARSAAQFEGKVSAAARSGHIPGAHNVPYPSLLHGPEEGFLDVNELRAVFARTGIDVVELASAANPRDVIVYCNGGVSATVPMTALAVLGIRNVALYDGSWNEWGNDPARAIER